MHGHKLDERIELGQLLAGGPETVLSQLKAVRDTLGVGIVDLTFIPLTRDKLLHAIELFGTRVLPCIRDL